MSNPGTQEKLQHLDCSGSWLPELLGVGPGSACAKKQNAPAAEPPERFEIYLAVLSRPSRGGSGRDLLLVLYHSRVNRRQWRRFHDCFSCTSLRRESNHRGKASGACVKSESSCSRQADRQQTGCQRSK